MRTEKEIRERLDKLKKERLTEGPYIEKDNIAWHATKQALECARLHAFKLDHGI